MSHWIDVDELPPSREKDILIKIFEECFEMNRAICGECKWHVYDDFGRAWVCTNDSSDYVADFTDYTDGCDCYEQRGIE